MASSGAFTLRVRGYREAARALNTVDKKTRATMLLGMKRGAKPIAADARSLLSRYQGLNTSSIQPRAVATGVYVTQKQGKKTGLRPDFGSLQMTQGLIPAAYRNADQLEHSVELALDVLALKEGF